LIEDKTFAFWHEIEKERNEDLRQVREHNELLERFYRGEIALTDIDEEEALYLLYMDYKDQNEFVQRLTETQRRILYSYFEKMIQQNNFTYNERIESYLKTKEELNRKVFFLSFN
jgi:hypothetical protein